jgi:capsid protein
MGIADGELDLPSGKDFGYLTHEFVPLGIPWWDRTKEVRGAAMEIAAGFSSPQRICREIGTDFEQNVREIRQAMAFAEQEGVPLTFADSSAFRPSINVSAEGETDASS